MKILFDNYNYDYKALRTLWRKPIDLMIGGFHLMPSDREEIAEEITALREATPTAAERRS